MSKETFVKVHIYFQEGLTDVEAHMKLLELLGDTPFYVQEAVMYDKEGGKQ